MLDILSTVLAGGVTGFVGSFLGSIVGIFKDWRKEKAEAAAFERELQLLDRQASIRLIETESEARIASESAWTDIRKSSYNHDTMVGITSRWVNDVLRLVRPTLTLVLIILVGFIYFNEVANRDVITHSVLYMMSSAVLWWFGDRALKNNKK